MRALLICTIAAVMGLILVPRGYAFEGFQLLRLDGNRVKWGVPVLGTGATVSYAFIAEPSAFPKSLNCGEMTSLDELRERSGISSAEMRREVRAAFAMWERAANIEFVENDEPATAQILIGAQAKPRWSAFANVVYRRSDESAIGTIDRSLICLNPSKRWKIGFSGDPKVYDLRYTIAHEIGHAIGLDHPGPSGQLMSFKYLEMFRELQPGDVAGAVALYGLRPSRLTTVATDSGARDMSAPDSGREIALPAAPPR